MSQRVPCSLCGSHEAWEIYRHPCRPIAHQVCRTCGLGFLSPRPTAHEIDALYTGYRQAYPDDALAAPGGPFDVAARARAGFVSSWLEGDAQVLEVGCGYGHFVRALRERGVRARGLDPSQHQVDFARSRLGTEVERGGVESLPESGAYDGIAVFHVLEHLHDPGEALRRIARALRPGGRAFVEVPHALRLPADAIEHFYVASGQHLTTFSPRTLAHMAAGAGLEPLSVEHAPLPAVYQANLRMVATRSDGPAECPAPRPQETLRALASQRDALGRLRDTIRGRIAGWQAAGRRIAIYGAGFHTLGVLDLCRLSAREIALVVDDDPAKHGTRIEGLRVAGSDAILSESVGAVLISSLASEEAIAARLAPLSRADVEVARLYESTRAEPGGADRSDWEGASA